MGIRCKWCKRFTIYINIKKSSGQLYPGFLTMGDMVTLRKDQRLILNKKIKPGINADTIGLAPRQEVDPITKT